MMLMMFAGPCTGLTDDCAGLHLAVQNAEISLADPRQHAPCGNADVRSIEIETHAGCEIARVRLAQTGIGTGGAGLRSIKAVAYAGRQCIAVQLSYDWMHIEHVFGDGHDGLLVPRLRRHCGGGDVTVGLEAAPDNRRAEG